MSAEDPLASPTLAQLYITQGHYERAESVLEAVLGAQPLNAHALALRERVDARRCAHLSLARQDTQLLARFAAPHELAEDVHVLLASWRLVGGRPVSEPLRSRACLGAEGELLFPAPAGPASACACLARLDAEGALEVLAVAEPLTW